MAAELQNQTMIEPIERKSGTDSIQTKISSLDSIDREELSDYILLTLKHDIADRESGDFESKRIYDINAYEGRKKATVFPWKNAANYAVPLTPTLIDTAHPNILNSIFSDTEKITAVRGVGKEDERTADKVSNLLNWQMLNELDTFKVMDSAIHRAFKHGTGVVKVVQGSGLLQDRKVILENVPFENVFLPINATGFQVKDTDHVFELIEWTENDRELRRNAGLYKGLEDLQKGFRIVTLSEAMQIARDTIAGSSVANKEKRDSYFILECYLTYFYHPKGSDRREPKKSIELICWLAPRGGKIFHLVENSFTDQDGVPIRPYIEFIPYPRDDRFYGTSLPEKIRQTQLELDHAHNQNINAADRAIAAPGFYPQGSDFDPELHQIVPGGMYPVTNPGEIVFAPASVNPIFERQEERYWDLAERQTGLTELFQGRLPDTQATLGATVLRSNRTDIRFKTLYKRFENGWRKMVGLIYLYDLKFMPTDKKIKILGVNDYVSIKELFPEGISGKYDFSFSSEPITEKEVKMNRKMQLGQILLGDPMAQEPGNRFRILAMVSEALGERNLSSIIHKPQQADILSVDEAIQRIMSGQTDIVPDPNIDAERYILKIQLFMKTDTFANADPESQQGIVLLLRRAVNIRQGNIRALVDKLIIQQGLAQRAGGAVPSSPVVPPQPVPGGVGG